LTIRELFREFVIAKQLREDERHRDITLAWTTAALGRQKKLPELKTLLAKREVNQHGQQNVKQLGTSLKLIAEAYGLKLRKKKR
jgi:hypothetical protein